MHQVLLGRSNSSLAACALLCTLLLTLVATGASAGPPAGVIVSNGSRIFVNDGLLGADILDMPLAQLTRDVSSLSNVDFVLSTPSVARARVTARVSEQPLDKAIKALLAGFSYTSVMSADSDRWRVTIHASHTGDTPTASADESAATTPTSTADAVAEWTVDSAIDRELEMDEYADEYALEDALEAERLSEEDIEAARVEQALQAIESNNPVDRMAGIDALVGVADSRAGLALARVASDPSLSPDDRLVATVALANHAADRQFDDEGVLQALATLANDSDGAVAEVAQRVTRQVRDPL